MLLIPPRWRQIGPGYQAKSEEMLIKWEHLSKKGVTSSYVLDITDVGEIFGIKGCLLCDKHCIFSYTSSVLLKQLSLMMCIANLVYVLDIKVFLEFNLIQGLIRVYCIKTGGGTD